jgi:hypothetical protein
VISGVYCPICDRLGESSEMRQSGMSMLCPRGHVFNDMAELLALGPRIERTRPRPQGPQPGTVEIRFWVTPELKRALEDRFGAQLSASLAALAIRLIERGSFVVGADAARRISELVGERVSSDEQLVAAISVALARAKTAVPVPVPTPEPEPEPPSAAMPQPAPAVAELSQESETRTEEPAAAPTLSEADAELPGSAPSAGEPAVQPEPQVHPAAQEEEEPIELMKLLELLGG